MVVKILFCELELTDHSSSPWLTCTKDDPLHPRVDDRPHAHSAGLDGDIESRGRQPVVVEQSCCFAQHRDFGVCARVTATNGGIVCRGNERFSDD